MQTQKKNNMERSLKRQGIIIKFLILLICLISFLFIRSLISAVDAMHVQAVESVEVAPVVEPVNTLSTNEIYEANKSAVITVLSFEKVINNSQTQSTGSGFVYKYEDGQYYAITNYHVIKDYEYVEVIIDNGTDEKIHVGAEVLGANATSDIAVLTFETNYEINPVTIGNSDEITVGETVIAIGSPIGNSYQGTVTTGIISTRQSSTQEYIQSSAATNPGNSGGPLFNAQGEVIGINTLIASDNDDTENVDNISFAIPINYAMEIVAEIEAQN